MDSRCLCNAVKSPDKYFMRREDYAPRQTPAESPSELGGGEPDGWFGFFTRHSADRSACRKDQDHLPKFTTSSGEILRMSGGDSSDGRIDLENLHGELGLLHGTVGEQAEVKHSADADKQHGSGGLGNLHGRKVCRVFGPIDRADDPEIIVERNDHANDGDADQPVIRRVLCALFDDGLEQEKFPEESGEWRNARERHHRQHQAGGEQWRALVQTGQHRDVVGVAPACDERNDHERGEDGEQVAA